MKFFFFIYHILFTSGVFRFYVVQKSAVSDKLVCLSTGFFIDFAVGASTNSIRVNIGKHV